MRHIQMFSGGGASWLSAMVLADNKLDVEMLFADTLIEDDDLYRFLIEGAAVVCGVELRLVKTLTERCNRLPQIQEPVLRKQHLYDLARRTMKILPNVHWIADGRTPWEVFKQVKFLGNSRVARCSHDLKQKTCREWLGVNCHEKHTTIYVGIHWSEMDRFAGTSTTRGAKNLWLPWDCKAPLCEPPLLSSREPFERMIRSGIKPPRLYKLGYTHNNCGGFCVKAGHGQFKRLLETMPDTYAFHENKEQELRQFLDKNVSIMKDRRGGRSTPLTMREFREQLGEADCLDVGGCGCFSDDVELQPEEGS